MSFVVRKPGAGAVALDDLGITVTGLAASERDLRDLEAADIAASADLAAAISGGTLVVLDPRDDSTALSIANGELARATANDAHYGVAGGRFGPLDDPATSITDEYIVQYNSGADEYQSIPVSTALVGSQDSIGAIVAAMGQDGTDTTFAYNAANTWVIAGHDETNYDNVAPNGTFVGGDGVGGTAYVALDTITLSDGTVITVDAVDANGDVTQFTVTTSGQTAVTPGVALTQSSTSGSGTSFTLTPENANITAGTLQWNTDDVFLRNTGDTLDSGTLTIASGATINIASGGDLTIQDAPVNPTDAANKEYVDTVATGLDFKESVHMCTVSNLAATYNNGTSGLGATLTGSSNGVLPPSVTDDHAHFVVGTRILVKEQTDPIQNGIYTITDLGSGEEVSEVTTTADSGDSLDGTYFEFNASNGAYFVWYSTSGGSATVPAGTGTAIQVNINTNAVASAVTAATIAAINASSAAVVAYADEDNFFYIVDNALGNQTDATDVDTGFTVSTTIQGDGTGTPFVLTRSTDADNSPSNEVSGGMFTFVEDGATCAATGWVLVEPVGQATIGTDDLVFEQFSGQNLYVGGNGITINGNVIDLDIDDTAAETIVTADELAFNDVTDGVTKKTTVTNFLNDLDIVTHGGGNGILVKTADDTYTNRSIEVGTGNLDGLAVTNGDGVSGNPSVGLDIQNMTLRAAVDAVNDRVAVWDSSLNTNVYYTINDIATAGSAVNSFETWAGAGNTSGDASIVADAANDTATLTGGIGINIDFTAASDTLTFSFTRAGMADTAVVGADTVPFFDASATNEPEYRSWTNIISDLSLATAAFTTVSGDTGSAVADTASDTLNLTGATNGGITTTASDGPETVTFGITPIDLTTGAATLTTSDFIMVSDSADTASTLALKYTFGTIITDLGLLTGVSASVAEDELGIVVTGGDTVGLDILGLTDPNADMAAADEFPVHDKSEGTAGANRKMTGQNIADGVAAILDIATLTFDVFPAVTSPADDQTLLAYTDSVRVKTLSVESHTFTFADNSVNHNDWIDIGGASDALTGYIMPLDGTVVGASAHTEDANGNTFDMDLYVDAADSGSIANLTGATEDSDSDPTLNIDFSAGQKLRIRADRSAGTGKLGDTVVVLTVKWRS
jgi:hypothetical protein